MKSKPSVTFVIERETKIVFDNPTVAWCEDMIGELYKVREALEWIRDHGAEDTGQIELDLHGLMVTGSAAHVPASTYHHHTWEVK